MTFWEFLSSGNIWGGWKGVERRKDYFWEWVTQSCQWYIFLLYIV